VLPARGFPSPRLLPGGVLGGGSECRRRHGKQPAEDKRGNQELSQERHCDPFWRTWDASDYYLTGSGRVAARAADTRSHVPIAPARRCQIMVSKPSNVANGGELSDCGCIPWPSQVLASP
jgi:hypothetical protein